MNVATPEGLESDTVAAGDAAGRLTSAFAASAAHGSESCKVATYRCTAEGCEFRTASHYCAVHAAYCSWCGGQWQVGVLDDLDECPDCQRARRRDDELDGVL